VLSALSWRVDGPRPLSPGQWLTIPTHKTDNTQNTGGKETKPRDSARQVWVRE